MLSGARVFDLTRSGSGKERAEDVVSARAAMDHLLATVGGPLIAKIYAGGAVKLWLDRANWRPA